MSSTNSTTKATTKGPQVSSEHRALVRSVDTTGKAYITAVAKADKILGPVTLQASRVTFQAYQAGLIGTGKRWSTAEYLAKFGATSRTMLTRWRRTGKAESLGCDAETVRLLGSGNYADKPAVGAVIDGDKATAASITNALARVMSEAKADKAKAKGKRQPQNLGGKAPAVEAITDTTTPDQALKIARQALRVLTDASKRLDREGWDSVEHAVARFVAAETAQRVKDATVARKATARKATTRKASASKAA